MGLALLALQTPAAAQPRAAVAPIPDAVWAEMQGRSWHPGRGCAPREALALVRVPYRDFDGVARTGELVVARHAAPGVARAFERIFEGGFRIARIERIDRFGGDDDASMAANNTSAFNCRTVPGAGHLSRHALGTAVDINPVQNPWVRGGRTRPAQGRAYDRPDKRRAAHRAGQPGLIRRGDVVWSAFQAIGWRWGGAWKEPDYQHFSDEGR
jgi:hypothetical protein